MKRTVSQRSASVSSVDSDSLPTKQDVEKDGRKYVNMPKKGLHRMHAHINPFNPLNMEHPKNPDFCDWAKHYPQHYDQSEIPIVVNTKKYPVPGAYKVQVGNQGKVPTILDIGCGYGGLLFQLKKAHPDQLILGLEIRDKVANYVGEKINSMRHNTDRASCMNTAVIRSNAMKTFSNYFRKGSVSLTVFMVPG